MSVIRKSSMFAAVFLGFCVGTAHAQEVMRVNVPFAFVAGHDKFAAGEYDIRTIDGATSVIAIEGVSNRSSFGFVLTNSVYGKDPAGDQPALVFTRHENQYRLGQVWDSTTEGRELQGFEAAEREARAAAQGDVLQAQTYVLAANRR